MKKIGLIIFLLSVMIFPSGCWNYRELNSMAIVGSIGIDYNEEDKLFKVSVQVYNAKKTSDNGGSSDGQKSPITYYENEAKTIHEALRGMVVESPKKLYIGHLEMIVFGQSLSEKHFTEALDFLFRDAESRKNFILFVTKDCEASDVLKILTPLESLPSSSISDTLVSNSTYYGTASSVTYDQALAAVYGTGLEVVLPVIQIEGNVKKGESTDNVADTTQKTRVYIEGTGIFKNNHLIGYLNEKESRGYNFIVGNIGQSIVSFPCDDEGNYASIELVKTKSGAKTKLENNQIVSSIEVTGEATLSEVNCKMKLTDEKNITDLEKMGNRKIEEIINTALETIMQEFNSDVFGFGNQLYRTNYKFWQKSKDDWDELFPKIKTKVTSKVAIKNKGSVTNSTREG